MSTWHFTIFNNRDHSNLTQLCELIVWPNCVTWVQNLDSVADQDEADARGDSSHDEHSGAGWAEATQVLEDCPAALPTHDPHQCLYLQLETTAGQRLVIWYSGEEAVCRRNIN